MYGRQDQAAARQVLAHDLAKQRAVIGVQGREGLVEKPKGARACHQTRQGEPAPLSGRQDPHRQT